MNPNSDPLSQLAALTQAVDSRREAERANNRARFPELAEFMDARRAEGATVKLIWAINRDGASVGPVPDDVRREWVNA